MDFHGPALVMEQTGFISTLVQKALQGTHRQLLEERYLMNNTDIPPMEGLSHNTQSVWITAGMPTPGPGPWGMKQQVHADTST